MLMLLGYFLNTFNAYFKMHSKVIQVKSENIHSFMNSSVIKYF